MKKSVGYLIPFLEEEKQQQMEKMLEMGQEICETVCLEADNWVSSKFRE